jgi:Ca2+-binding EF-hand superfamily protein
MRTRLAIAVVVSALPFSIVSAQSRFTSPPDQTQQNQQQNRQQMRWANMDRNGDGVITRAEWQGTAQAFQNADWDNDGILSGYEVNPNVTRDTRRPNDGYSTQAQQQGRYTYQDRNGDGVITRAEWRGTAQEFQTADWNRDGILSGDEVGSTGTRSNRRLDPAAQQRDARFQALDQDRNGQLSRQEWPDSRQSFFALDRNGDGVVSRQEMVSANDIVGDNSGQAIRRRVGTSGDIVRVNPKEAWTDTGLDVRVGDRVSFDAEGRLQLSEGGPDVSTPTGSTSGRTAANAPLPRATAGALIGRIGNSAPLLIGNQRTIERAPVSGRLYLGVNDDHLPDNSGEYRVSVTIDAGR